MQGLALLRSWLTGDPQMVDERLSALVRSATTFDASDDRDAFAAAELTVPVGYGLWAETYDEPGNPIVELETPVERQLLSALPAGRTVDVACGTGRHTSFLQALGHRAIGVDVTPEMLAKTRRSTPSAPVILGDVDALPLESDSADAAVCALALTHSPGLRRPVEELARVVRPGGTVIISDVHPFLVALGGQALFRDAGRNRAFVRNHLHLHGDYLRAFAASNLRVRQLIEPTIPGAPAALSRSAQSSTDVLGVESVQAALLGLPAVIVWELSRA